MLLDLHAYTQASGGAPLEAVVDKSRSLGLDGIAIVDRERSGAAAQAVVAGAFGDFPVFVGVEIGTRSGDAVLFAPNLDPFLTREEWREVNGLEMPSLAEVVALAERVEGVVLLGHPYDRNRKGAPRDRMYVLGGVAGVEIGTDNADARANRIALEAVGRSTLPGFGGTARRGALGAPGWLTLFASPVRTQADLVRALRGGDFWAVEVLGRRGGRA